MHNESRATTAPAKVMTRKGHHEHSLDELEPDIIDLDALPAVGLKQAIVEARDALALEAVGDANRSDDPHR